MLGFAPAQLHCGAPRRYEAQASDVADSYNFWMKADLAAASELLRATICHTCWQALASSLMDVRQQSALCLYTRMPECSHTWQEVLGCSGEEETVMQVLVT